MGSQDPTATTPSSGYWSNRLAADIGLNDAWSLRGDFLMTNDRPSPPATGANFGDSGGWIPMLTLGLDFDPNDHWSLSAAAAVSPKSSQFNDAPISLADAGILDADLRSNTSSLGGSFGVSFDTAGESDWETAVGGVFGATRYQTGQAIAAVAKGAVATSLPKLRTTCQQLRATVGRAPAWCAPLLGEAGDITQVKLSADATETIYENTEVGATFVYYLYDKDPTQVGYFTLASRGRITGGTNSFGEGLAIAPYQFTVKPEVAHTFGPVRVDLAFQYGQYVPGQGDSTALSLKVSYRFNKMWKVWASGWGERDVDGSGNVTQSSALSLGVRCHF